MAHGDGTIKLLSKPCEPERYEVNVSLGRDPETGKYRRKKKIVFGTFDDVLVVRDRIKETYQSQNTNSKNRTCARQKATSYRKKVKTNSVCASDALAKRPEATEVISLVATPINPYVVDEFEGYIPSSLVDKRIHLNGATIADLATYHAERKKAFGKWSAHTEYSYWQYMNRYILPYLGSLPVQVFDTEAIEEYYLRIMSDYHERTGKSAAGIINEIHGYLKPTFATAIRKKLITENPCDEAERPRYEKPEKGTLTLAGMRRLLRILDDVGDTDFTIAVRISLSCGLRPEEVLGLEWRAIDLDRGKISITQAKSRFGLKDPKTKSSKRVVAVDKDTLEHICAFKKKQQRRLWELGKEQSESTFVVLGRSGSPLGYETFKTQWRRFRVKHQIISTTGNLLCLHELRHSYASLLISQGAPLTGISKALGHRDVNVTCRVYLHALPGQEDELAEMFGQLTEKSGRLL